MLRRDPSPQEQPNDLLDGKALQGRAVGKGFSFLDRLIHGPLSPAANIPPARFFHGDAKANSLFRTAITNEKSFTVHVSRFLR